jgi:Winged helix DNA-binding domain
VTPRLSDAAPQSREITPRVLNRATLARQLLLRRHQLDAVEAVRRIVALQAQEPPSPYVALWNRVSAFDPSELERAFASHTVVKATLMRITLHAVAADDYPFFHEAMQLTLRASRLNDRRFRSEALTSADADELIPDALAFADAGRSNAEMEAWIATRFAGPKPFVWWALRQYGPFVHAPTGGAWSFGTRPTYRAAPRQDRPGEPERSLRYLVRRYLEGFGPATVADVGTFGLLYRQPLRDAVDALERSGEIVRVGTLGREALLDVPDGALPDEDTPAPPRLLPMWDSTLLAYAERDRIVPPEYRKVVSRSNGDTLPTLLVDGYVAGVWRPTDQGIEATAFRRLTNEAWEGLEGEARSLLRFLEGRGPRIYTRYVRWWSGLPDDHVRLLGRD